MPPHPLDPAQCPSSNPKLAYYRREAAVLSTLTLPNFTHAGVTEFELQFTKVALPSSVGSMFSKYIIRSDDDDDDDDDDEDEDAVATISTNLTARVTKGGCTVQPNATLYNLIFPPPAATAAAVTAPTTAEGLGPAINAQMYMYMFMFRAGTMSQQEAGDDDGGGGLHSSTSQLNLSRFCH